MRRRRAEVAAAVSAARKAGDAEGATLLVGQTAGLIRDLAPAGELVERIVRDAEGLLRARIQEVLR